MGEKCRRYHIPDRIRVRDLRESLEQALAELGEEPRLSVRVEGESQGIAGTTVVVIWLIDKIAGKMIDKTLDIIFDKIVQRIRQNSGSDALQTPSVKGSDRPSADSLNSTVTTPLEEPAPSNKQTTD